jgi:hypothetical protein
MAIIHRDKWKSKGLGDTIEKITTVTGIKKVAEAISRATGDNCGCEERKQRLNNPDLLVNKVFYNNNNK